MTISGKKTINIVFLILLFTYPFENNFRVYNNFSVIDLFAILAITLILRYQNNNYFKIIKDNYGSLSILLIALMIISNSLTTDPFGNFIFIFQIFFILLIVIPIFISTFQHINFNAILFFYFSFFTLLHFIGYVLAKFAGYEILVADSGNGRFFPSFVYATYIAPAFFITRLLVIEKNYSKKSDLISLVLFLVSTVNVTTTGSRAMLFGIGLTIIFVLFIGLKNAKINKRILLFSAFIAITAFGLIFFESLTEFLFTRNLADTKISDDNFRYDANWTAINQIKSNPMFLFFGVGHEEGLILEDINSYGQPVHNMIIQMAYEFGIFSSIIFALLLFYPLIYFLIKKKSIINQNYLIISTAMFLSSFGAIAFHTISSQRSIWIGYAIIWSYFYYSKCQKHTK